MSYCRWSCLDGMCDLYVYGAEGDTYVIHVARSRPVRPSRATPLNDIGLPSDGQEYVFSDVEDAIAKVRELKEQGYIVPDWLEDDLRSDP